MRLATNPAPPAHSPFPPDAAAGYGPSQSPSKRAAWQQVRSAEDATEDVSPAHGFHAASMATKTSKLIAGGYGVFHRSSGRAWKYHT